MRSAGYRFGVDWIAHNDESGNGDSEKEASEYVSTALLADLFGVSTKRVARDVIRIRKKLKLPTSEVPEGYEREEA